MMTKNYIEIILGKGIEMGASDAVIFPKRKVSVEGWVLQRCDFG